MMGELLEAAEHVCAYADHMAGCHNVVSKRKKPCNCGFLQALDKWKSLGGGKNRQGEFRDPLLKEDQNAKTIG